MTRGDMHEDLVGFALGALDEEETARIAAVVDGDPARAAELERILKHLDLHDAAPALAPAPALWRGIRERIEEPVPTTARPVLRRFWMPAAAAALVAAAFLWPRQEPRPQVTHGQIAVNSAGTYSCATVSRMRLPGGVVVTLDTDTVLALPAPERLALRAGRVFLEVPPGRAGFAVECGGLTVTTLGTAFGVGADARGVTVAVERGAVRCVHPAGEAEVEAGGALAFRDGALADAEVQAGAWFRTPGMSASVLAPDRVRIVLNNEMPDAITLAPPTGGEPLFFATIGSGHTYPLTPPADSVLRTGSVVLDPGAEITFELRLPQAVPDTEPLFVTCRANGKRVEARR